jgi:hypothetical protein
MRGEDERSGSFFGYFDLEVRVGKKSSFARNPRDRERSFGGAGGRVFGAVFADRAILDSSGKAIAGDAAASVLFDPLGAAVDGPAGVRPAVPLVRRHRHRRCCVGSFDVFDEPRSLIGGRHRRQAVECDFGPAARAAAFESPVKYPETRSGGHRDFHGWARPLHGHRTALALDQI